jgi:cytochrome c oxidase assembly protein subunit 15
MEVDPGNKKRRISPRHHDLLVMTAGLTFVLVVMGGIVCVTDSSRGCPDWPACYGRLVPPPRLDSIIEYVHRVLAGLASLSIAASAAVGWWKARRDRWISLPPVIALFFLLVVVVLGATVVLRGLGPGLAAVDLGSALIVLALVLVPPVASSVNEPDLGFDGGYVRLVAAGVIGTWLVLVSAVLVADSGSVERCLGWPVASGRMLRGDIGGSLQLGRFVVGGVVAVLIVAVAVQTWRVRRERPGLTTLAKGIGVVMLLEALIGSVLILGDSLWLRASYALLATALWSLLVMLATRVGLASDSGLQCGIGNHQLQR